MERHRWRENLWCIRLFIYKTRCSLGAWWRGAGSENWNKQSGISIQNGVFGIHRGCLWCFISEYFMWKFHSFLNINLTQLDEQILLTTLANARYLQRFACARVVLEKRIRKELEKSLCCFFLCTQDSQEVNHRWKFPHWGCCVTLAQPQQGRSRGSGVLSGF